MTQPLNEIMEFDRVIEVHKDGSITYPGILEPELYDGQLSSDGWELLNGYSGQDRYSGPIMHPSEFISGGMEDDIRTTPGMYVALVTHTTDAANGEDRAYGWAVAKRKEN